MEIINGAAHYNNIAVGENTADNTFTSAAVTSNPDGSVLERLEWIQTSIGGEAIQLRTETSASSVVEENAYMQFSISLMDIDTGAVASASIDITGISVELAKSTGGAAFSAVGITQPTFSKANGRVYSSVQFLAAEWEVGDVYRLTVSGITATVGGDTAYVPMSVWSNMVVESLSLDTQVAAIQADIGDPSARTNLKSLLALLGNPDVASSSIWNDIGNYVGQTNLQSLLASMGVPDVAGKSLYVCLVTDRLDNATYGLSALDTEIDAVQADVGNPSARANLTSLEAMLGNPDGVGKTLYANLGDYVGQANLQSLLASLGIPDVAGKSLYVCLVTDRLDNGTYGLAALNTDLDSILADVGDASGSTLTSIYAILGNPATSLTSQIAAIQTDLGDPSSRVNLQTLVAMLGNPDAANKSIYGNIGDFVGQTNLQSLLAALGIPDVAAKSLYTCLITDRLDSGTFGLSALNTDTDAIISELAKVPKSDAAVTWNGTALASVNAEVDTALNTAVPASPTAGSINDILSKAAGGNTFNKATDSLEALADAITAVATNVSTTAAGKDQVFVKEITSAANATDVTLATVTAQSCLIESIVVVSNGATTVDLTNIGVYGGASKVITFIDPVTGVKANLDAVDEQVAYSGNTGLKATKTIVMTLTGTGGTAVDFTVYIKYRAIVNGGYLA